MMTATERHNVASVLAHRMALNTIDRLYSELKAMEQEGKKDTTEWLMKWDEYKRRF